MSNERVILIAERNPHIRDLVKRELISVGHYVFTVENTSQLKNWMYMRRAPDVLILDPDLPGGEKQNMWDLLAPYPQMRIIIHSLVKETDIDSARRRRMVFVEKNGNSITCLKQWIDSFNRQGALDEAFEG